MNYKDLINLGFKRTEAKDEVWFNQYGYGYFFLELNLNKNISMVWQPDEPNEVIVNRCDKEGFIQSSIVLHDLHQVKALVNLFKGNEKMVEL